LLIASVDSYESASFHQKVDLLNWIEKSISHESVTKADTDKSNWWRAELLYALKYLKQRSKSPW
jgi:hypothetical protein